MSENPYGKSRVVWMFDADQDRAIYESSRRWIFAEMYIALPSALALSVMYYLFDIMNWGYVGGIAIGSTIPGLVRIFRRKVYGITGIVMQLEQKHIDLHELFSDPSETHLLGILVYERKCRLMRLPAKKVKSARWVSDGCLLDVWHNKGRGLLIHNKLLAVDGGLAKFRDWCDRNNIEIDGVPPLDSGQTPYAALRETGERRGG